MATPLNDDSRMLFKLLADGEWHSYEEIRDRLAATVPPGRALRKYQERLDNARQGRDVKYEVPRSEDEQIYYGQRGIAQATITSWKGRAVMSQGAGADKQIRLKPGFRPGGVDLGKAEEAGEPESPSPAAETPVEPPGEPEVPDVASEASAPATEVQEGDDDEVPFYAGPVLPLTEEEIATAPRRTIHLDEEPVGDLARDYGVGGMDDLPNSAPALEALAAKPRHYARYPEVTALGLPALPWICPRCDKENTGTTCDRCGVTPVYAKEAYASHRGQKRVEPPSPEPRIGPAPAVPPSEALLLPRETIPADDYKWPSPPVSKEPDHRRCDECGLLMSDEAKHADWHTRYIARSLVEEVPETATFAESEIRTLVGDVVGKHLDDFQAGMERYLSAQFSQLEALIRGQRPTQGKWRNQR